ncbi:hypothetical protein [Tropicibacter sp. S64]|uniref:hypothetical protein n=1 Tax=Tropicibacter sp. S64 TaxID=3415122 RepID=UPI003C7C49DC
MRAPLALLAVLTMLTACAEPQVEPVVVMDEPAAAPETCPASDDGIGGTGCMPDDPVN